METLPNTLNSMESESMRLVKAFLENDQRAFDQLILLHKNLVFNLCYRFLGNYDDADDCAQEVFIKIYRFLKSFRFESNFTTWLYRVTVNTCKNRLHSLEYRFRTRRIRIHTAKDTENDEPPVDIRDDTSSPEVTLQRKESSRLMQAAINTLPAQQKLIVVLRDMDGRSYEEIVEITGCKLGTVKSTLSRARQQLRDMLKGKI